MTKCKICGEIFENSLKLSAHIRYSHKISIFEYMTKFKSISEGVCATCGEPTSFWGLNGWSKFCKNPRCPQIHEDTRNKIKQTCIEKYGVDSVLKSEVIRTRIEETNIKKYGNICSLHGKEIEKKVKQTKLEKYNDENYNNRDKFLKTMTPEKWDDRQEKTKRTKLEKYNDENYNNRDKFLKTMTPEKWDKLFSKAKQTKLERYNDENYTNPKKQKETIFRVFGTDNASNIHIKHFDKFHNKDLIMKNFVNSGFFERYKLMEYFNCSISQVYKLKKKLEINIPNKSDRFMVEKELSKFIPNSKINDRIVIYPKEIDIYSEINKFGIEYNGLIWHSFGYSKYTKFNTSEFEKTEKYNHLKKTELCEQKGIQLYHIFENEWINPIKKNIWKSMINSKLKNSKRIYARKCIINEISSKESSEFLEQNHIQGNIAGRIKIGLFYDDELVQVMTFRTPTQKKYKGDNNYELSRLCSKTGINVIGGASKLLKYFERNYNPELIISYANRRWSIGNVYEKLGFKFSHKTAPNYFYFRGNTLESRNKYQKHKLNKILPVFNPELTEKENMFNNGYRRIYDCGNLVYVKIYKGTK